MISGRREFRSTEKACRGVQQSLPNFSGITGSWDTATHQAENIWRVKRLWGKLGTNFLPGFLDNCISSSHHHIGESGLNLPFWHCSSCPRQEKKTDQSFSMFRARKEGWMLSQCKTPVVLESKLVLFSWHLSLFGNINLNPNSRAMLRILVLTGLGYTFLMFSILSEHMSLLSLTHSQLQGWKGGWNCLLLRGHSSYQMAAVRESKQCASTARDAAVTRIFPQLSSGGLGWRVRPLCSSTRCILTVTIY